MKVRHISIRKPYSLSSDIRIDYRTALNDKAVIACRISELQLV